MIKQYKKSDNYMKFMSNHWLRFLFLAKCNPKKYVYLKIILKNLYPWWKDIENKCEERKNKYKKYSLIFWVLSTKERW